MEKFLKGLLKRGTRLAGNRTVVQGKSNPVGMAEFLADDPHHNSKANGSDLEDELREDFGDH